MKPKSEEEFVLVDSAPRGTISAQGSSAAGLALGFPLKAATLAVLILVGLIYFSSFLFRGSSNGFPVLAAGSYVGKIENLFPEPTSFYLEKSEQDGPLLVLVLRDNWQPQLVGLNSSGKESLVLTSTEGSLKFDGIVDQTGFLSGQVADIDGKAKGTWAIRILDASADFGIGDEDAIELNKWMTLRTELEVVENTFAQLTGKIAAQKEEIDKLNTFLSDEQLLKSRADKSFDETKQALQLVQEKLQKKQAEANSLSEQLKVSERITNAGKLVSLARESLERESRWQESMLKTESGTPEFMREMERAEMIQRLKVEINQAKERLLTLQSPGTLGGGTVSPWDQY